MLSGHSAIVVFSTSGYWATNIGGALGTAANARSFGGRRLCVTGGRRLVLLLFPEQPALQAVEVDIDNRRRIKCENLRQSEAADDGVTERLANLRADARTHH